MPDINAAFSSSSLGDLANKATSALGSIGGKISTAVNSTAAAAGAKIKSAFASKDLPYQAKSKPSSSTPESTRAGFIKSQIPATSLVFPTTMKYYTLFKFIKYERGIALKQAEERPTVSIVLPIPSNLNEAFAVDYDTPALGPIAGAVVNNLLAGQRAAQAGGDYDAAKADNRITSIATDVMAAAGLKLSEKAGDTAKAVAQIASGTAPNPNLAVLFRNIGLREHSFSYRFAPHSQQELKTLKEIIKHLKIRMLPGYVSGADALYTFPDMCDISFTPGAIESFKMKRCVLKNLSVNYAPNGPAFFKTGDPVVVEISMTFMEMSPVTRRDFGEADIMKPETPATPGTNTAAPQSGSGDSGTGGI